MARVNEFGLGFETVGARQQMAAARRAEELGFGTFWVPEDYFYRGAFALASAIACSTARMRVGLGVVNPYTRHPAVTAMELATLTEIAGPRTVLGIGASVRFWIEGQMGIPYARPKTAMRETVDIVRGLLRGEAVSLHGRAFRTEAAKLSFPSPAAEIPVHLGVIGPQNLEMAGEIADGVLLSAMTSPAYVRFALEHLRNGAERAGRRLEDLEIGAFLFVSVSENEREARDAVKPFLATLVSLLSGQPESPIFTTPGMPPDEIRRFGEAFARGELPVGLVTDWMIDTYAIAGGPDHCREQLGKIVDAGVLHPVAFEIPGVPPERMIEAVHRHLMPHFL
jgi:5,10-methylenetetrahydromethanopterin reductase